MAHGLVAEYWRKLHAAFFQIPIMKKLVRTYPRAIYGKISAYIYYCFYLKELYMYIMYSTYT